VSIQGWCYLGAKDMQFVKKHLAGMEEANFYVMARRLIIR